MFRGRHLKIVLATGTLAFGVNMPCRTTVFCMDHKKLTPLIYRQMSGRAGRRGYDDVGHVVFFGLPTERASHLMTSQLSSLQGSYPLTTALSMRSVVLYNQVEDKLGYLSNIASLIDRPLLSFSVGDDVRANNVSQQLKFHFRFALNYLLKSGFIDQNGSVKGLGGLASHLYFAEPTNFALTSLLSNGVIRNICRDFSLAPLKEAKARELLRFLAHLLVRTPVPSRRASPVTLQPLSDEHRSILNFYNRRALQSYVDLYRVFARLHLQSTTPVLPLSNIQFSASDVSDSLAATLNQQAIPFELRSPFAAISGHGDHDFSSAHDLVQTIRDGIEISLDDIPSQEVRDVAGHELNLNSYVHDFFANGQLPPLIRDNQLRAGVAYDQIKLMQFTLEKVAKALKQWSVVGETDEVVMAFEYLSTELDSRLTRASWSDV
eukprot:TRINITY_DN8457_c0_g1_i4.p1 TRINITY_DN8457_c0_g1~~TRINITY_DN8457_c0_g1_i4.p1  ORF type:complete len:434 (-),score=177.98 TRINITY_DN8457_c0_g1_i4:309-1610(-)